MISTTQVVWFIHHYISELWSQNPKNKPTGYDFHSVVQTAVTKRRISKEKHLFRKEVFMGDIHRVVLQKDS